MEIPLQWQQQQQQLQLQHFAIELASCSASAKWPTVHSSHALCGKRNTTRARSHTRALALALSLPACLPFRHCHCVSCSATIVCVHTTETTTVYELALLFNIVQFHLKLSSVRLLTRFASSTTPQHNTRRPHNTFACGPLFLFFSFCFVWYSLLRYINRELQVRARQTPHNKRKQDTN